MINLIPKRRTIKSYNGSRAAYFRDVYATMETATSAPLLLLCNIFPSNFKIPRRSGGAAFESLDVRTSGATQIANIQCSIASHTSINIIELMVGACDWRLARIRPHTMCPRWHRIDVCQVSECKQSHSKCRHYVRVCRLIYSASSSLGCIRRMSLSTNARQNIISLIGLCIWTLSFQSHFLRHFLLFSVLGCLRCAAVVVVVAKNIVLFRLQPISSNTHQFACRKPVNFGSFF